MHEKSVRLSRVSIERYLHDGKNEATSTSKWSNIILFDGLHIRVDVFAVLHTAHDSSIKGCHHKAASDMTGEIALREIANVDNCVILPYIILLSYRRKVGYIQLNTSHV